jgi:carboxyl-terminal processing protease
MTNFYFNTIRNFAFDYVDNNRKKLKEWSIESFIEDFDKNDAIFSEYLSEINDRIIPSFKVKQSLKRYLKTTIANNLFGDVGFYRMIQLDDKMIQKVLELESTNE